MKPRNDQGRFHYLCLEVPVRSSIGCCMVLYGPTKWGNPPVLPGPQWRPNGFSIQRTSSGVTSLVYKDWHIDMICQKISVWQQQQHDNFSNSSFLFLPFNTMTFFVCFRKLMVGLTTGRRYKRLRQNLIPAKTLMSIRPFYLRLQNK